MKDQLGILGRGTISIRTYVAMWKNLLVLSMAFTDNDVMHACLVTIGIGGAHVRPKIENEKWKKVSLQDINLCVCNGSWFCCCFFLSSLQSSTCSVIDYVYAA